MSVSELMNALYQRQADEVDRLLAADPELDLFEAAALGRTERLAELAADVGARAPDGFSALHLACFFGQLEAARLLIERGAEVNLSADNPTQVFPLHSAAAGRSVEIVSLLLEHGAEANARQHGGWTALQAAVMHDDAAMAGILLDGGANPDQAADDDGPLTGGGQTGAAGPLA